MNTPEYKHRAKPYTHNAESLDRTVLSHQVLKLLKELESLDIIPPKNGKGYTLNRIKYNLEDGDVIELSERQMNLAKVSSEGYDAYKYQMLVRAGYSPYAVFAKEGNWKYIKNIKQELTSKYDLYKTEAIDKMINHLRYNGAIELHLDAKWLLNEQVDLYSECRRNKMYTQAVRLLHDISYHIDIDARVSNKLEVTEKVDYAALLNNAEARTKSLPAAKDTDVVEGEFTEVIEMVQCKGKNCKAVDGIGHSEECIKEHNEVVESPVDS